MDPLGLDPDESWYQTWERWADIKSAQQFWEDLANEQINEGDWLGATGADIMSLLLDYSQLGTIQDDAKILGSNSSRGKKILAAAEICIIGVGWFYGATGKEIVPRDPKKLRIAPMGNRNWRRGWKPVTINQLPHYHYKRPGPGGSYKWHRPWEKGF